MHESLHCAAILAKRLLPHLSHFLFSTLIPFIFSKNKRGEKNLPSLLRGFPGRYGTFK
jgi:hypothetical protein